MEEREKGELLMCKVGQVSIFDWDTGCSVCTVLDVSFLLYIMALVPYTTEVKICYIYYYFNS